MRSERIVVDNISVCMEAKNQRVNGEGGSDALFGAGKGEKACRVLFRTMPPPDLASLASRRHARGTARRNFAFKFCFLPANNKFFFHR